MIVDTAAGPRRVELSTVALAGAHPPAFLHLLRRSSPSPARAGVSEAPVALTPRQREILGLLANGVRVKAIASHLGLTQTTVRNHIRGLLSRLGCHSQLEAVAKARRLGTVERGSVAPRRGTALSRRGPEAGRRRPPTT
jgi:DNA-binding NarL/FixJ family response regulator